MSQKSTIWGKKQRLPFLASLGLVIIVIISGCSSIGGGIGTLSKGQTYHQSSSSMDFTLVDAKVFESYSYRDFYGGGINSEIDKKNVQIVLKVKNTGTKKMSGGIPSGITMIDSGGDRYYCQPTQKSEDSSKDTLYPGAENTLSYVYVFDSPGSEDQNYAIPRLKQHADLQLDLNTDSTYRMAKAAAGDPVKDKGDIATWDITSAFN